MAELPFVTLFLKGFLVNQIFFFNNTAAYNMAYAQ